MHRVLFFILATLLLHACEVPSYPKHISEEEVDPDMITGSDRTQRIIDAKGNGREYKYETIVPETMNLIELDSTGELTITDYCSHMDPQLKFDFENGNIIRQGKTGKKEYTILAIESISDSANADSFLQWNITIEDPTTSISQDILVTSYLKKRIISFRGFNNHPSLGLINDTLYADALEDDHIAHIVMMCY